MYSTIGFVTDLVNKGCDDLRPRFCFEMFGGCFIARIGCAQSSICWQSAANVETVCFAFVTSEMKTKPLVVCNVSHVVRGHRKEAPRR